MKRTEYLGSAALLSFGGLFAKGIGALYRIPLSGLLGGYGMGLYQMAYPLFCLLLTFSSAGIPSALSRMIARETARGRSGRDTLKAALRLFALLGLCGTALMCLFAPYMSALQGDANMLPCYFMLAPSVFLVALIAVLRGYFQGRSDMRPTAFSELVEQAIKAAAGLFFAYRFRADPPRAVAYCLLSVTLSELSALLFLVLSFGNERRTELFSARKTTGAEILYSVLPVMAATSLLPLSQTADSVILVRLLAKATPRAVTLYGFFTGGALSLVSLPATICYGFAAAAVPSVAGCFARGAREEGRARAMYALCLTLLLSVPCAAGLFLFAKPVVSVLYPGISGADFQTLVGLVRLVSVSAVSLSGVNTLAACLTGMGKAKYAAFSMLVAIVVKFALQGILVPDPSFSVGGAAIAANACYLVAFFLDLFYTVKKPKEKAYDHGRKSRHGARRPVAQGEGCAESGGRGARPHGRDSAHADA